MGYQTIEVRKVTPVIGAEVHGVDLTKPLGNQQFQEMHDPPMGSILHLQVVPPDGGGDTMFANMYRAYETLSEPIKKMLAGMTAMHEGEHVYRGRYGVNDEGKVFPKAEQPVVRTHPVTGRQALYVNRGFTTRIVGLKRNESAAILEMLYQHIATPELSCRSKWQVNSIP